MNAYLGAPALLVKLGMADSASGFWSADILTIELHPTPNPFTLKLWNESLTLVPDRR